MLADWTAIVGPAIAAVTTPRRLSAGTLTIACAGPIAMELQHLAGEVMARINAHLGSQVVTALRFVQTFGDAPPVAAPCRRRRTRRSWPQVEASVAHLPDGELRAALAALGQAVVARSALDSPLPKYKPRRSRSPMTLTRRTVLSLAGGAVAVGGAGYLGWRSRSPPPALGARRAAAAASSATLTRDQATEAEHRPARGWATRRPRSSVTEFFSLTCTHCAAFARETMPQIEKDLIQPGKVRFVFHDFPLDQVALTAAMVARYLPPTQYYPFVSALLANQDRWAFARGVNTTEEIWKLAALAGMSRATFDQALADNDLRNWILHQQQVDQDHLARSTRLRAS